MSEFLKMDHATLAIKAMELEEENKQLKDSVAADMILIQELTRFVAAIKPKLRIEAS